jgi:hypothetical protein
MTKLSGLLAVGLVGALGVPAWAAPPEACACRPRSDHAVEELGHHKSAFAGRVKNVREEGGSLLVTFDVHRVWKGPRGKLLTVKTDGAAGACGYVFETGKDYLVYADGEKGALATDRCAANSDLADSGQAVRQLDLHTGRGATPLQIPDREAVSARR